jgi:hypothetical protein
MATSPNQDCAVSSEIGPAIGVCLFPSAPPSSSIRYSIAPGPELGTTSNLTAADGLRPLRKISRIAQPVADGDAELTHGAGLHFQNRPHRTGDLRPEQDWDVVAGDFGELATKLGS